MPPIDYSKWDDLEISSDEDEPGKMTTMFDFSKPGTITQQLIPKSSKPEDMIDHMATEHGEPRSGFSIIQNGASDEDTAKLIKALELLQPKKPTSSVEKDTDTIPAAVKFTGDDHSVKLFPGDVAAPPVDNMATVKATLSASDYRFFQRLQILYTDEQPHNTKHPIKINLRRWQELLDGLLDHPFVVLAPSAGVGSLLDEFIEVIRAALARGPEIYILLQLALVTAVGTGRSVIKRDDFPLLHHPDEFDLGGSARSCHKTSFFLSLLAVPAMPVVWNLIRDWHFIDQIRIDLPSQDLKEILRQIRMDLTNSGHDGLTLLNVKIMDRDYDSLVRMSLMKQSGVWIADHKFILAANPQGFRILQSFVETEWAPPSCDLGTWLDSEGGTFKLWEELEKWMQGWAIISKPAAEFSVPLSVAWKQLFGIDPLELKRQGKVKIKEPYKPYIGTSKTPNIQSENFYKFKWQLDKYGHPRTKRVISKLAA